MTKHSDDHEIITPLYDRFDEAEAIIDKRWVTINYQFQYLQLVQWKALATPVPCRTRHIFLHERRGLKAASTTPYASAEIDMAEEEWSL